MSLESEQHMSDGDRISFRAEIMRQFKDTDAYKLIRAMILGQIQDVTRKLLDDKVCKEEKVYIYLGRLRALNDILSAIDMPQAVKQEWDRRLRELEEMEKDEIFTEPVQYNGAGGAM